MDAGDGDGVFYFGHDDLMALLLPPPPPPPAAAAAAAQYQGSAFAAYHGRPTTVAPLEPPVPRQYYGGGGGGANVHRRMDVYLRAIGGGAAGSTTEVPAELAPVVDEQAPRSSRFRHIMRERLRRERLSQGFADLHALLPAGRASKGAKNFIVAAAADYIRELEGKRRWLHARNEELQLAAPAATSDCGGGGGMVVKVRAESYEHPSAVDAFEVVLRRLKAMEELRVTWIRSCFCAGEMSMDVGVESKMSSSAVDNSISNALMELEEIKSGCLQDPTNGKSRFSCQVENGALTG